MKGWILVAALVAACVGLFGVVGAAEAQTVVTQTVVVNGQQCVVDQFGNVHPVAQGQANAGQFFIQNGGRRQSRFFVSNGVVFERDRFGRVRAVGVVGAQRGFRSGFGVRGLRANGFGGNTSIDNSRSFIRFGFR